MIEINSFDVFDTVVTRVTGSPTTAFLLLGKQLLGLSEISCTPETFARLRIAAERLALKNIGESTTLHHIYEELGSSLGLTVTERNQLMVRELALQSELIRFVPCVKEHIKALRHQGQQVIFVSDMHLPSDFIKQQLVHHQLWRDGDRCYVSCEYGKSKLSGGLFPEVLHRENISPSQISHLGNDLHADVEAAKKIGIEAKFFSEGNLNRYEKILESYAWSTEGFSSVIAGASRLARLTIPASSSQEEAIRDVTAGVVAPILVGYVLWLLRRAQELNLKRLYFLSRDGQILLEIARKLVSKLNYYCELRYLYGSRLSWNRATIKSFDEHWIWYPLYKFCSLEYLFDRLDIQQEEIIDSLSNFGFTKNDWCRSLSKEEVQLLRSVLNEKQVRELILRKTDQKRQILRKYLGQEGLLDSDDKGIVDLGWAGSMYSALSRLIDSDAGKPLVGFYFAKNRRPNIDKECQLLEAYFFDERINKGFLYLDSKIKEALELFCSADHGTVMGFKKRDEQVYPVLEEDINQRVISWGLPMLRKTTDCFIENLLLDSSLVNTRADIRECSAKVFEAFWLTPSQSEARAWGSLPWDEHLASKGAMQPSWAESYKWKHVFELLLHGNFPRHHSRTWVRGSIVQSPPLIQKALKYSASLRRKSLRRVFRKLLKLLGFEKNLSPNKA
ncbi:MAG: HAD family hydrolase [Xenococcaceae cyanobacterium]